MSDYYVSLSSRDFLDMETLCGNPDLNWEYVISHPKGIQPNKLNKFIMSSKLYNEYKWKVVVNFINDNITHVLFLLNDEQLYCDMVSKAGVEESLENTEFLRFINNFIRSNQNFIIGVIMNDSGFLTEFMKFNNDFLKNVVIPWDMASLSRNKSLTWKIIENNPDGFNEKWKFCNIFMNPNVATDLCNYIESHPDGFVTSSGILKWNDYICLLFYNSNLSWDFVARNFDLFLKQSSKISSDVISKHKNLTWKFVKNHLDGIGDVKWDVYHIAQLHDIDMSYVRKHLQTQMSEEDLIGWHRGLSLNPYFDTDIMIKSLRNPDLESYWDFSGICKYNRFGDFFKYIGYNPEGLRIRYDHVVPWDTKSLSSNRSSQLTGLILNHETLNGKHWDVDDLFRNSVMDPFFDFLLRIDYVRNYVERDCGDACELLSSNPYITWDYIIKDIHSNKIVRWRPRGLLGNPTLIKDKNFWQFISDNPSGLCGKSWPMFELSSSPNLDWNLVEKYPKGLDKYPWCVVALSENPSLTKEFFEKHQYDIFKDIGCMFGISSQSFINKF